MKEGRGDKSITAMESLFNEEPLMIFPSKKVDNLGISLKVSHERALFLIT